MRFLPLTDADRTSMLAKIGVTDIDALFSDVPAAKLLKKPVNLPFAKGELEVERILGRTCLPRPAHSLSARALTNTMCLPRWIT
jgi:glycine cleavage system pyridoxal-binding protein P